MKIKKNIVIKIKFYYNYSDLDGILIPLKANCVWCETGKD